MYFLHVQQSFVIDGCDNAYHAVYMTMIIDNNTDNESDLRQMQVPGELMMP